MGTKIPTKGRLIGNVVAVLLATTMLLEGRIPQPAQIAVNSLYEKARAEGEVVLWGAQDRELDWIPGEFGKRFPGIDVKWVADRAAGTRIIAEQRASRYAVDVFTFSLGGLLPLHQRKLLGTNDWSIWGSRSSDVLLNGTVGTTFNLVYTVVYNDKLVKDSELPKTWEDLLAARWKGKLTASQFLLPRLLGFLALEWGEAKAADYARALIDRQDILLTRAPREGILQRGERIAAVGEFLSASLYWKSLGMPTAWVAMPIMPAAQFGVATLARAPHPNAARLLAGWMTSAEAKAARERLRFEFDARPGSGSKLAGQIAGTGARIVYEDAANMSARADLYERFSKIVTGRSQ